MAKFVEDKNARKIAEIAKSSNKLNKPSTNTETKGRDRTSYSFMSTLNQSKVVSKQDVTEFSTTIESESIPKIESKKRLLSNSMQPASLDAKPIQNRLSLQSKTSAASHSEIKSEVDKPVPTKDRSLSLSHARPVINSNNSLEFENTIVSKLPLNNAKEIILERAKLALEKVSAMKSPVVRKSSEDFVNSVDNPFIESTLKNNKIESIQDPNPVSISIYADAEMKSPKKSGIPIKTPKASPRSVSMATGLSGSPLKDRLHRFRSTSISPPDRITKSMALNEENTFSHLNAPFANSIGLSEEMNKLYKPASSILEEETIEKPSAPTPFQYEILEHIIDESLANLHRTIREDIRNLHVDMIQQLFYQKVNYII